MHDIDEFVTLAPVLLHAEAPDVAPALWVDRVADYA